LHVRCCSDILSSHSLFSIRDCSLSMSAMILSEEASVQVEHPIHSPSSSQDEETDAQQCVSGDIEKATPLDNDDDDHRNELRQVAPTGPDSAAFPDGGFDAWMAVAGGFCTIFASFGWINCRPTAFDSPYQVSKASLTTYLLV
jgi:hypothetical protein